MQTYLVVLELVMNFTEKVTNNYGHQIFMAPILSNDI